MYQIGIHKSFINIAIIGRLRPPMPVIFTLDPSVLRGFHCGASVQGKVKAARGEELPVELVPFQDILAFAGAASTEASDRGTPFPDKNL